MNPSALETEKTNIRRIAENYEKEGYSVQIAPSSDQLPEFLHGYQPDMIVRGPKETLVVEVKTGTTTSAAERFREIAESVNAQPGWKFVLLYVPEGETAEESPTRVIMTKQDIEARISQAQKLYEGGDSDSGFLLLWTALEGFLRLLSVQNSIPVENLPPSAMLKELYSSGELSVDQYDVVTQALKVRNSITHGFKANNNVGQVFDLLLDVVKSLSQEIR